MIILLTDFGLEDEYVGVMKGVILSNVPDVKICDLCHGIAAQDVSWAGMVVYKTYKYFPHGSIFVCCVDPGVGTDRNIIILHAENRYFIAPDNGLLTQIFKKSKKKNIVKVNSKEIALKPLSSTFHGRDIFAPLAVRLCRNKKLDKLGVAVKNIKLLSIHKPKYNKDEIRAHIIHIDKFGNIITDLDKGFFKSLNWENFQIAIKGRKIDRISSFYQAKEALIAIWESKDLLEIASPGNSAANLLNIAAGDIVKIFRR